MWLLAGALVSSAAIFLLLLILVHKYMSRTEIENLNRRCVFITGCDTGFGNLLARTLDARGVSVIAGCLTEKGSADLKEVTSSRLKTVIVDVTDNASVVAAYEYTRTHIGEEGLWGLVNNAGIMPKIAPAEWMGVEEFEETCKVNLFGTISMTLTFLPLLRQSCGRLVNVCSVTSTCGFPGLANYVVSKAGVKMFTACVRRELMNTGVTAHTIEPGGFKTNITEKNRLVGALKKAYIRAPPETRSVYAGNICTFLFSGLRISDKYTSGNPQNVADAMTHALLAKYPKKRYLVGTDAKVFFRVLTWLPEWVADSIFGWPTPYGKLSEDLEDNCSSMKWQ